MKARTKGRLRFEMVAFGVFALALCARLLHVLVIKESPFFDNLLVDSVDYDARATAILHGSWPEEGAFYQPPLYPLFLALIYRVLGHDFLAVRVVQAVLGSVSAALVYLIGRRCAGKAAGIAAGIMYSLYAMSIHFDAEILMPAVIVLPALCSLYLMLRAADGARLGTWMAAGFLLGLTSTASPTVLVFLPLALLWTLSKMRGGKAPQPGGDSPRGSDAIPQRAVGKNRVVAAALVLTACALAPVAAVTGVNYVKSGSFVPVSYNGGINFYIGNNSDYDGTVGIRPGIRWDLLTAEPPADRRTDPSGWSAYYYGKAENYIIANTKAYLALLFKKLALFWNGHEIERNTSFAHVAEYSPFMKYPLVSFRWVAPLALAGMALALRGRAALGLPALFLFSQMAVTVAFFVCARYRMPSVPILCIFAGYGAVTLAGMIRGRSATAAAYAAVAVLGAVAVNVDAYGISKVKYSRPDYERALIMRREGRTDEAVALFRSAALEDPRAPDPPFQWGALMAGRGAYGDAAELFERAALLEPRYAKSWFNLGLCRSRLGRIAPAIDAYRRALEADPSYWEAGVGLGDALLGEKRLDEAAAAYGRSLELAKSRQEAAVSSMSLGRVEALLGNYESSLAEFDRALAASPRSVDARLAKARVLLLLGRTEHAAAEARAAADSDSSDSRVKALLKQLGIGSEGRGDAAAGDSGTVGDAEGAGR